jgi:hypothetical protein
MASKKATFTTTKAAKKATTKKAITKKAAKKAITKKAAKKAITKKAAKKATTKKAATKTNGKTITATITLTGEREELKASEAEIIEAAKKIIEKELRKQIRKA